MNLPSGISENEFLSTVSNICNVLAPIYKFGYYDIEDIKQEGFIFAYDVVDKFDPSRGSLNNFLTTRIKNMLINLRRDKLTRKQSPCLNCQKCEDERDKLNCMKYMKWKLRNNAKQNLMECTDYEFDISDDTPLLSDMMKKELVQLIDRELPVELRSDYKKLIEGNKLSKCKHIRLVNMIKDILKENDYE
jgi:RNA polymerase sigma factor (sigma-70 family)